MLTSFISLKNATKNYGENPAVKSVTFDILQNEVVALLGPSGSGKTTLLRLISKLEKPDAGNVECRGTIGMVFQSLALWPHTTVQNNLELVINSPEWTKERKTEKVKKIMKDFGLQDWAKRKPGMLSGGQQQRVALARAIVSDPQILLLDEPLAHLDNESRTELRNTLKPLLADRIVIIATHDLNDAQNLAQSFYEMKAGVLQRKNS
jgi:ABC-type sugar transport system ATPase subunit